MTRLRALLIDGGATLFPEGTDPDQLEDWAAALAEVAPELTQARRRELARALADSGERAIAAGVQHSDADTAAVVGPHLDPAAVRHALARARGTQPLEVFPGAAELLAGAKALGLTTVLVSNTSWHSEADYRARLEELGLSAHMDAIVSSFDVGFRKPDWRVFAAALERARCEARHCVMAGDSEPNDIAPARALGMRTIRITVQYGLGDGTMADAEAGSLVQALARLRGWAR